MIEAIKAIIVGLVQGLTEFLPVSSSGHIIIAQEVLGLNYSEDENLIFVIVLHFATALSTIVIFRKEIADIFVGLFQFKWNNQTQFAFKIILSMIPAALVGLFLEEMVADLLSNLRVVGACLLVTAVLLYFANRAKKTDKDVSFFDALVIGIAQSFAAILPGLSRSGTTISTSILLGVDKAKSASFSFLMVLPLIFGAAAKKILDLSKVESTVAHADISYLPMVLGFFAAFLSGLLACRWMIAFVKKSKLTYFSIYCLLMGLFVLIYSFAK